MFLRHGKKLAASAMIVAFGLVSLIGCNKKQGQQQQMAGPAGPPEVSVLTIQPQKVALTTELPGRTVSALVSEVRPQVGGIIKKRLFSEGSEVKAGQVLYQIDPASYEAALASAVASKARAEATLGSTKLRAERYAELVTIRAVSQQDNDDAQAALKQAEAELAAAKAAVINAEINLAYTKIVAPISGRIGRSSITDGALVTANQDVPLATIQQLSTIYVDVTQSSSELLRLKRSLADGTLKRDGGGHARVKLLLEDGTAYLQAGTLGFSEVTVEESTGSITLRAVFPNPQQILLPGMFVRAILEEGVQDQAILVPQQAVSRNPKGEAVVMLVNAEETVVPTPIKVVRTVGNDWLVAGGLNAGDRVIMEGVQRTRPGSPVKAVPFGAAAEQQTQNPEPAQEPEKDQQTDKEEAKQ